jgi:HTH-type transcriptional regulator / antitoxin HipB
MPSPARHRPEPDPTLRGLSARLREARIHRGLSQEQLAQRSGLTRLRVIDIERGSPSVSMGAYAQAARSLGLQLGLEPHRRPVFDELKDLFP